MNKISVLVIICMFLVSCDPSPSDVKSVTYRFAKTDSTCSGQCEVVDTDSFCDDLWDCPGNVTCEQGALGYYYKTEYSCSSTYTCPVK